MRNTDKKYDNQSNRKLWANRNNKKKQPDRLLLHPLHQPCRTCMVYNVLMMCAKLLTVCNQSIYSICHKKRPVIARIRENDRFTKATVSTNATCRKTCWFAHTETVAIWKPIVYFHTSGLRLYDLINDLHTDCIQKPCLNSQCVIIQRSFQINRPAVDVVLPSHYWGVEKRALI